MNDQLRSSTVSPRFSAPRTGLAVEDIKQSLIDNLFCGMGRIPAVATRNDLYTALALTVRDRVFHRGVHTIESHGEQQARRVAYLSAEYLPGPHLALNLLNLGITDQMRQAVSELGYDLDALLEQEEEPGLGNGGLTAEQVSELRSRSHRPRDYYERNSMLRDVIDLIASGALRSIGEYGEQIWNAKPVHVEVGQ